MKPVHLAYAQILTALGDLDATLAALHRDETAVRPVDRFAASQALDGSAAFIDALPLDSGRSRFFDLLDALFDASPLPPDAALYCATTKGPVDLLETALREGEAPPDAASPRSMADFVAKRLELTRSGPVISAACASSTVATGLACAAIREGRTSVAVVVAADAVTEFVFAGFASLRALSKTGARPFDRGRDGLSLGEAGALLILADEAGLNTLGVASTARIIGFGQASDAVHITAPARDGRGLAVAIRAALGQAGIPPASVAAINAHGTGTPFNDAMELAAFGTVFGETLPPLHSVKGGIGHTLGAAGAVEIALAARCLAARSIPPTSGCRDPESSAVAAHAQPIGQGPILSVNSGFGGVNAAIILETP